MSASAGRDQRMSVGAGRAIPRCFAACLALAMGFLSGCAQKLPDPVPTEADYKAVSSRIIDRVAALKSTYPVLEGIAPRSTDDLYFEHGVTWALDDPSQPAGKRNARFEIFDRDGFWIRLHFYRGAWAGAAMFMPVEFGDLKLWFSYGYRPGDDPAVIAAVSRIIDEEKKAFDAGRMPRTNFQWNAIPASTARWNSSCEPKIPGTSSGQCRKSASAPKV